MNHNPIQKPKFGLFSAFKLGFTLIDQFRKKLYQTSKNNHALTVLMYKLLVFLLFFTAGCQKKASDTRVTSTDQTLHISFSAEVCSLDPRLGVDFPSVHVTKMLFEGLMITGPHETVRCAIAKSYDISEDHKTYIFHLRPSYWSNGDSVTAYDFEYSWKKVIDPSQGSLGVHNFYPIKNVRLVVHGEKDLDSVGIKALDSHTLKVELEYPTPYFLELVTTSSYLPVSASCDQSNPNWANTAGEAFVCNGPYLLKRHSLENEILVEKNPTYWDAKHVTMQKIHISIIKDATTQLNLFEKGKLEWLGEPLAKIALDAVNSLKKKNKIEFSNTLGVYLLFINTESFPFFNKKMRKAFSLALDRDKIVRYILQCDESPAMGVLPYAIATQDTPFFEDANREKALMLFDEALTELGLTKEDLPEITLNYASTSANPSVMQEVQQQWNSIFGLDIKLERQDWKAHFAKLQQGSFQIGALGWQSWLRDPIYILQTFREKGDGLNVSQWEDPLYQGFLTSAEREIDLEKRRYFFNQAEALLMEEMPVIPLYFFTLAYCKKESLKNVQLSNLSDIDYRWSYFDP